MLGRMWLRRVQVVLKNVLFLPHFSPKPPPNVPQFSPFQRDASEEKSLNFSPTPPRKSPQSHAGQAEICTKKYGISAKSTMLCTKISRRFCLRIRLRRLSPEREDKWRKCRGFGWGCHVRRMSLKGKKSGGGQARGNEGKSCRN